MKYYLLSYQYNEGTENIIHYQLIQANDLEEAIKKLERDDGLTKFGLFTLCNIKNQTIQT